MKLRKGLLSCGCLGLILAISLAYLAFRVLDINPGRQNVEIVVTMGDTGGLMDTSAVAMHGLTIGRVRSIVAGRDGVDVTVSIDAKYAVPASSKVIVQNLSPVGEQYLDFRPDSPAGPYLADGARVGREQVVDSASVGSVLGRIDRLGELIDPAVIDRMGVVLKSVTADKAALSSMKLVAELMASTIADKSSVIRELFVAAQTLDMRLMSVDGPGRLRPVAGTLQNLAAPLADVIRQLNRFGAMSAKGDTWNSQIGPFMTRLLKDVSVLLPEFGGITAALAPVTAQLRGIRVNVGAFTDLWARAFPSGGPMRVQLTVK
ncbi:MlaD family protein [Gordonia sp. CPCC 205333]|uniref:MlaD family protein n=1 Tax=Gordonia sp. CPCC 205333 TaxID=3140790 RepID=UPI003AF37026